MRILLDVAPALTTDAELIVELTQHALSARDLPAAVEPILSALVERTAAAGAAYFQREGGAFHARAAHGAMPAGPAMDAVLAHGLSDVAPVIAALDASAGPLFFADTAVEADAAGFPDLGVASLAAAPVRDGAGRVVGAFLMHTFTLHDWTGGERALFASVAGTLASLTARLVAEERLLDAREGALRALGLALEYRDVETAGHTDRVVQMSAELGRAMGLDADALRDLRWGAYLHDVGKIATPDDVLLKRGPLSADEREVMNGHALVGREFAERLGFLPPEVLDVVEHHHERWDGRGYPAALAGRRIPLAARIFAVCDVYDALTSERPYKRAWTHEQATAELAAQSGAQFDPEAVAAFLRLWAVDVAA